MDNSKWIICAYTTGKNAQIKLVPSWLQVTLATTIEEQSNNQQKNIERKCTNPMTSYNLFNLMDKNNFFFWFSGSDYQHSISIWAIDEQSNENGKKNSFKHTLK